MTCAGTNRRGFHCGAHSQRNSEFCFFHDPTKGGERRMAQSKGGGASLRLQLIDFGTRLTMVEQKCNQLTAKVKS